MNKVAIVVLSYRMPSMTDTLVESIKRLVHYPHDLYVIDNGSPDGERAAATTHRCDPNRRFTGGFNFGIECVRSYERASVDQDIEAAGAAHSQTPYDAIWFVCNDIRLLGSTDPLAVCMAHVKAEREAKRPVGIIHPSLSRGPDIWNWPHMYGSGRPGVHESWFVDIICPVYTREMMEALGWQFDPALVYGWGVDIYSCFEAWEHDLRVVVADDVECWHKMGTTYAAGKDKEFNDFDAYKAAAGGKQHEVLQPKYGPLAQERGFGGDYMKMFQAAPAAYHKRLRR